MKPIVILGIFVADTAYRAERQPKLGETILGKTGELLGMATLKNILPPPPVGAAFEQEKYTPWQVEANYGWVLEDITQFPITVSIKGKLGLWELPEDTPLPESLKRLIFNP